MSISTVSIYDQPHTQESKWGKSCIPRYLKGVCQICHRVFSELKTVILGTDIDWVMVYRREIEVEFFEGNSTKTFFLSGYDERVDDIRLRVQYMRM